MKAVMAFFWLQKAVQSSEACPRSEVGSNLVPLGFFRGHNYELYAEKQYLLMCIFKKYRSIV